MNVVLASPSVAVGYFVCGLARTIRQPGAATSHLQFHGYREAYARRPYLKRTAAVSCLRLRTVPYGIWILFPRSFGEYDHDRNADAIRCHLQKLKYYAWLCSALPDQGHLSFS